MRDVCDVAYVLLVEQLERRALADRQAVLTARLFRGDAVKDDELPALAQSQPVLDENLISEPEQETPIDMDQWELRRALGVA